MAPSGLIPKPVSEYDLRLLRVFKVVVECGGFSKAETVLNVTRSTISVHMSNLESRMKFKLAYRGRAGFALTEQGKAVYEATLKLFGALDDFSFLVSSLDQELKGELIILCSDNVSLSPALNLSGLIREVAKQAPGLNLSIDNRTTPEIESSLLNGESHIGIMPEFRIIKGLDYKFSHTETFFLCCGKDHRFFSLADDQITQAMLKDTKSVHPGVDINHDGLQQLQQLKLSARSYHFETRLPLIFSGEYIGFFPLSFVQSYLDAGLVRLIQPELRHYGVKHAITTRVQQIQDPKVTLFMKLFDELNIP